MDGDIVCPFIKHDAGIKARFFAVDDGQDLVLFRVPHESVGGFTIDGAEVRFAIYDRGFDALVFTGGAGRHALCGIVAGGLDMTRILRTR
jgi:hypothetical protein